MSFTIQWFWLIKVGVLIGLWYSIFNLYKTKGKSIFWIFMTVVGVALSVVNPIKIQPIAVDNYKTNRTIVKVLPKKVIDNSFQKAVTKDITIHKDDLK